MIAKQGWVNSTDRQAQVNQEVNDLAVRSVLRWSSRARVDVAGAGELAAQLGLDFAGALQRAVQRLEAPVACDGTSGSSG